MSDEKIREVLDRYADELSEIRWKLKPAENPQVEHMITMIPKMRGFLSEGRREKLMRWLGFVQGAMWAGGFYTIDQLKDHNRPDEV